MCGTRFAVPYLADHLRRTCEITIDFSGRRAILGLRQSTDHVYLMERHL
ncbi:hypothetical protein [Gordonibacter pamelaeae]